MKKEKKIAHIFSQTPKSILPFILLTKTKISIYFNNKKKCLDKKLSGKSKEDQMAEKKQELEKRLQDVTGQLGSAKKANKKGKYLNRQYQCLARPNHWISNVNLLNFFFFAVEEAAAGKLEVPPPAGHLSSSSSSSDSSSSSSSDSSSSDSSDSEAG